MTENFPQRMLSMVNDGMLCLMTGIGHKTGLFDAMSGMEPATSQEIAKASRLNERYVCEWLGGMVTGRIVDYNPETRRYSLPKDHTAVLTRAAGLDNLSVFAQYVALMAQVEDKIVDCFRKGGGVPYSAYPKFQELQGEETRRVFDARLIHHILPLTGMVDLLNEGIEVLDVGCGEGYGINLMAKAFPKSMFYGYDISREGMKAAKAEAKKMKLANVHFKVADAAKLEDKSRFDLITAFDTIHDQAKPARVLRGISRALRKDGVFLMQDIAASSNVHENMDGPLAPTLYTVSTMHCMTVSLAYGGDGLGTMWGKQKALEMLAHAGFGNVDVKEVDGDIVNYYYVARK